VIIAIDSTSTNYQMPQDFRLLASVSLFASALRPSGGHINRAHSPYRNDHRTGWCNLHFQLRCSTARPGPDLFEWKLRIRLSVVALTQLGSNILEVFTNSLSVHTGSDDSGS
jgi:hypothetical protein